MAWTIVVSTKVRAYRRKSCIASSDQLENCAGSDRIWLGDSHEAGPETPVAGAARFCIVHERRSAIVVGGIELK